MQARLTQRFMKNGFLLALLLHLLFFSSLVLRFSPIVQEKKFAPEYVPSYTYSPSVPAYQPASNSSAQSQPITGKKSLPETKKSEVSQAARDTFLNENTWYPKETLLTASKKMVQSNETQQTMEDLKHVEPMLMIGDSSQVSDPITQILARALSAHFKFPKMEDAFRVSGRVIISMVLHPEGNFTNVRIIESSNNQDFDTAALYAVNSAPRAVGADRFLSKPKYFVVGFLFGNDPRFQ